MNLILVRHCEPDYEHDSLTKRGWEEADFLADRVSQWKVDDFYVSPLGRAQDTARVCLDLRREKGLNSEAVTLPWLKEFYFNLKEPDTGEDLMCWDLMPSYYNGNKDLHDKDKWFDTPLMKSGDIRKEYENVTVQFDKLLEGYGYFRREDGTYEVRAHSEKTVVMFCHFGVSSVLTGHLTGIAPTCLWQGFFMPTSSVTIIGTEERDPKTASFRVQAFGDTAHLSSIYEPVSSSGYFGEVLSI